MRENWISFSASGCLSGATSRWLRPLEDCWPGGANGTGGVCVVGAHGPEIRSIDPDVLLEWLGRSSDDLPAAAVLVFADTEPAWKIDRAVEALRTSHVPGLILLPDPFPWRSFRREGVLFERFDTEPTVLSAMLYALVERQRTVLLLEREMNLTRRCEGRIREEMDRLHEELHLAASIQREFTTAPHPQVPGVCFETFSRPVNFVTGDVLCLRDLGDGRVGYFIADAAGHGVPAALLTMVLTHSLTTHEPAGLGEWRVLDPAEVLTRLNRRLCEHCHGSAWFATAQYGILDPVTREVFVAGAGHPPALVLSRGSVREIVTDGPVLGLVADAKFTTASAALSHDDMLLAYTDGFEDVFPKQEDGSEHSARPHMLGFDELRQNMTDDDTPAIVLARLARLIDEQCGSLHQNDDVTALVIAPVRVASRMAA